VSADAELDALRDPECVEEFRDALVDSVTVEEECYTETHNGPYCENYQEQLVRYRPEGFLMVNTSVTSSSTQFEQTISWMWRLVV